MIMKNHSIRVLFLAFLFLLYGCSNSSPLGSWDYTVNTTGGDLFGTMVIEKDGSHYRGYLLPDLSDTLKLTNVNLKENRLSSDFNFRSALYNLTCTFIGDAFIGEVSIGSDQFAMNGARANAKPKTSNTHIELVDYRTESKPVSLIFDSDFGPDYDDVGALAILHAMADRQEVDILATIASTTYPNVAPVLDAFNTYFHRPDIPIGIPSKNGVDKGDPQHWSDAVIAKYPHSIKSNDQAESATDLYRKILASSPDTSVTIVTVGFLTNMVNLLQSEPDEHSSLNGFQLVEQKVKELVSMAGRFPKGREFNVFIDAPSSIYTFENWPTDVVFSGFEIGLPIRTGLPLINNKLISNSPVKDAYSISIPMDPNDKDGRMSWDQTAVLFAVRGPRPFFHLNEGKIIIKEDGSNTWDASGKGHYHLVFDVPFIQVQKEINELMMHLPVNP